MAVELDVRRGADRAASQACEPPEIATWGQRNDNFRPGEVGRTLARIVFGEMRRLRAPLANEYLRMGSLDVVLCGFPADPTTGGIDIPRDADPAVLAAAVVEHRRAADGLVPPECARRLLACALTLAVTRGRDGGAVIEIFKLLRQHPGATAEALRASPELRRATRELLALALARDLAERDDHGWWLGPARAPAEPAPPVTAALAVARRAILALSEGGPPPPPPLNSPPPPLGPPPPPLDHPSPPPSPTKMTTVGPSTARLEAVSRLCAALAAHVRGEREKAERYHHTAVGDEAACDRNRAKTESRGAVPPPLLHACLSAEARRVAAEHRVARARELEGAVFFGVLPPPRPLALEQHRSTRESDALVLDELVGEHRTARGHQEEALWSVRRGDARCTQYVPPSRDRPRGGYS